MTVGPLLTGSAIEDEWHGWRSGDLTIHVGELPGRKSICLYEITDNGSVIRTLAFFKTPEAAKKALTLMDRLAEGTTDKETTR